MMLTKKQQLYKNKKPKITQQERDYLQWLQGNKESFKCVACGDNNGLEFHHITDIKRIKGKRRDNTRVVPLCGIECHRLGKDAIHVLSKEEYYKEVVSLEKLINKSKEMYTQFLKETA